MIPTTTSKPFDCIAYKRQAQEAIEAVIHGASTEEQIAYFRHRAESGRIGAWWHSIYATQQPHDYMTIQDDVFKDQTVDDIYERARQYQAQKVTPQASPQQ